MQNNIDLVNNYLLQSFTDLDEVIFLDSNGNDNDNNYNDDDFVDDISDIYWDDEEEIQNYDLTDYTSENDY